MLYFLRKMKKEMKKFKNSGNIDLKRSVFLKICINNFTYSTFFILGEIFYCFFFFFYKNLINFKLSLIYLFIIYFNFPYLQFFIKKFLLKKGLLSLTKSIQLNDDILRLIIIFQLPINSFFYQIFYIVEDMKEKISDYKNTLIQNKEEIMKQQLSFIQKMVCD